MAERALVKEFDQLISEVKGIPVELGNSIFNRFFKYLDSFSS